MRTLPTSLLFILLFTLNLPAREFIHPGMNQSGDDLEFLKQKVRNGEQPWQGAFEELKAGINLEFEVRPVAHISQGGYGKNDRGGKHLSASSELAYDCALVWYLSDEQAYADKAIEIINAWSTVLWDFDDNNAKLNAAAAANRLCQAAEILRYSNSGWKENDVKNFEKLLLTVFYPLLRYYFPEANGNWDGYIIRAMMVMGIFLNNEEMFNNAIEHFYYSPVNGSLFKYIYPSGQCQEATRDHGHVQMGLGAFANVAQIAWTQGIDLYSAGNYRLATGIEYEAKYLLGNPVFCYGPISQHKLRIQDSSLNYLYVYRHHASLGLELPYVKQVLDSDFEPSSRSILTAVRAQESEPQSDLRTIQPNTIAFPAGALGQATAAAPEDAIFVEPGESLQAALDKAAQSGGWVVAKAGLHKFDKTLKIASGVTLSGEGVETVLWLDPKSDSRDAMVAASPDLHDVTVRDLVIDGASRQFNYFGNQAHRSWRNRQNRGGIMFHGEWDGALENLTFINLTVKNCTNNGIWVTGAKKLRVISCDLDENGSKVVPGPKLQHNLLLTHCSDVDINGTRLDGSPYSSGLVLNGCRNVHVTNCEVARNAHYGILLSECSGIAINDCLVEGNDKTGIMIEYLYHGSSEVSLVNNLIQYNNGYGLESYGATNLTLEGNRLEGNRSGEEQQKISSGKRLIMNNH